MSGKAAQSVQTKSKFADSKKSVAKNDSHKVSAAEKSPAKAVGYLRVSTGDQELGKNKADILHLANHLNLGRVKFVEEIVSGKVSWKKRRIAEVIAEFTKGDILIVSELSRLGRSMLECMEILSVAVEKGVRVYAVKGNWSLDSSIQSKIVAMAFSMASEIERGVAIATEQNHTIFRLAADFHYQKSSFDGFRSSRNSFLRSPSSMLK